MTSLVALHLCESLACVMQNQPGTLQRDSVQRCPGILILGLLFCAFGPLSGLVRSRSCLGSLAPACGLLGLWHAGWLSLQGSAPCPCGQSAPFVVSSRLVQDSLAIYAPVIVNSVLILRACSRMPCTPALCAPRCLPFLYLLPPLHLYASVPGIARPAAWLWPPPTLLSAYLA